MDFFFSSKCGYVVNVMDQIREDKSEPREIFTMILTLAACENCRGVTLLLPVETSKREDRSTVLGAKASVMFVFMVIGLQAVKYVGKNV